MPTSPQPPETPPQKKSGGCLSWIALQLAVAVVLLLPLAVLAFDLGRVVFNPPLMKQVVGDEVINSPLLPVALEWFSDRRAQQRVDAGEALTGIDEPDIVLLMSFMDRADWQTVKTEVLPPEILASWVTATVDGTYAWIDSADRVPQIIWDLTAFKARLNTEHGVNAIVVAYDNLPEPCTQAQLDDFQARLAATPPGKETLYNLCKFPAPWHEDQFNDYVNSLHSVVNNAPIQFELTKELAAAPDRGGVGPEAIKQQLRWTRLAMQWAWVVPVALLLLVLLLAVRTLKDLGRWWGWPLLVGGVFVLLPALAYRWLITSLFAAGPLSETPDLVKAEAVRAITRLASYVFQPMLIQAIVIMVIGLILVIVFFAARPPQKADQPKKDQ